MQDIYIYIYVYIYIYICIHIYIYIYIINSRIGLGGSFRSIQLRDFTGSLLGPY